MLFLFFLIYLGAAFLKNETLGDIISPIFLLIVFEIIRKNFLLGQKVKMRRFSVFLLLGVLVWFVCELSWAIQTLVLHFDPQQHWVTVYGYSFTNLFFLMAVLYSASFNLKIINKMQALLDTLIVAVCIFVLLWLFIFEQNPERIHMLLTDPTSFVSLMADVLIYAWLNVWSFSNRLNRPPFHQQILMYGGLVFVITDIIYYYQYFYARYIPNSWIDVMYLTSFCLMGISAIWKRKSLEKVHCFPKKSNACCKLGIELFVFVVPVLVLVFKRSELQYIMLLLASLLIYYAMTTFTQKSIFQERLLDLEKQHVQELEKKVEERTEEISRILNTDFVSGLYNRRYFETKLSEVFLGGAEKEGQVCVLYIDQNKSRAIKNLYGKDISEHMLKRMAEAFKEITVANGGLIASYGDDVFVAMTKGTHAEYFAERIATKLVERCDTLFIVGEHSIRATVNVGISCYPSNTQDRESLVKNADIAMVQARDKGFNKIQFYSDTIGNLAYKKHRIELKLKKADFDKEFLLYYQPQVFCKDGSLSGFEALIRWNDGRKGLISPSDFIPVAEETGMIIPLGYWVIEHALKQYVELTEKTGHMFRMAVNVSAKQLVETDFAARLAEIIGRYDINPEFFEVEITESNRIENSIHIQDTLEQIKKIGLSIAIDDFGTGYSSVYYIKNIPADRIKIAKDLVDNIADDPYARAIIQMLVSAAKVKDIIVIAEGVETKSQWDCLKELGCDEIQGYYFAKPMPVDEVKKYLQFEHKHSTEVCFRINS